MATVYIQDRIGKNGNKTYAVRFKDPVTLKSRHDKSFKRKKDAVVRKNELTRLIDTGRVGEIRKTKRLVLTFSEVANHLKAQWQKRLDRMELSSNTVNGYLVLAKSVESHFGQRLLGEISSQDIEDYRDAVAYDWSPVSANRRLFIIQQVFKQGIELKTIHDNPAARVRKLSEKDHERNRYLLPEEIKRLIACCANTRAKFYLPALIYLAVEHGTAKQEALSLKWSDVNFDLYDNAGVVHSFAEKTARSAPRCSCRRRGRHCSDGETIWPMPAIVGGQS